MAFLRKWGTNATPNATGSNSLGTGTGAATTSGTKDGAAVEWHNDTPGERYFGMENFGNTCYANSVLQSLYFARPFRQLVEAYQPYSPPDSQPPVPSPNTTSPLAIPISSPANASPTALLASSPPASSGSNPRPPATTRPITGGSRGGIFSRQRQGSGSTTTSDASLPAGSPPVGTPLTHTLTNSSFTGVGQPVVQNGAIAREVQAAESTLLTAIRDLFAAISAQPKSIGTVAPQAFINQLKRDNEFFRSTLHQDAHEFLNFLVNALAEILEKEEKRKAEDEGRALSLGGAGFGEHVKTWVHSLFEGILTNETRCLTCETVTSRDEAFLDLSIDIEQNSSVTSCLRQFSASEMLCQRNKFSCDKCCGLQEAEKRMKVKKLPNLLALHLKRFKYEESLQRHVKLTYRVVFPFELRLFNTADDIANPDRLYELWAIVVHIGVGPTHGHYITIVKSGTRWIVFDDNNVYPIEQYEIARYFGDTPGQGSAYCLFYQAVDIDSPFSGLPPHATEGLRPRATTTSSASTGGVTGTSTNSKAVEEPPPIPPLPPAAVEANLTGTPTTEPLLNSPTSAAIPEALIDPTASLNVDSPSPLANGIALPTPSPSRQHRKPSLVSLSGSSAGGDRDVEKNGWSLKGRFTRTKSQATPSRSASGSAGAPPPTGSTSDAPPPVLSDPHPNAAPDALLSDRLTVSPNGSPVSRSTGLPVVASPAKTTTILPQEDDRASTISGSTVPPTQTSSQDRRRDSRLSTYENPLSASTSSSISGSPFTPGAPMALPAPPVPPSNGPLSATRNLFSRNKPRPQSSHGSIGVVPSSPSIGTGLGLSPGPSTVAESNLRGSVSKRPSTASPIIGSQSGGFFTSSSRSPSATNGSGLPTLAAPNGEPTANSSGSSSTHSTAPTPLPPPFSPPLSKKEAEKRLKEERKAREQEAKLREKAQKEQAKQQKEEAKRQEKLRKKLGSK